MTARRVDPAHIRVPLPHVQQRDDQSCGPAALLSVLSYYHVDHGGLERARKRLGTTPLGTAPERIFAFTRWCKLHAKQREGWTLANVLRETERGRPVIAAIQAHGGGHYVAIVGFDRQHLFVMDSCLDGYYGYLPKDEFLGRWWDIRSNGRRLERWAMVCYRDRPLYTRRAVPVPW